MSTQHPDLPHTDPAIRKSEFAFKSGTWWTSNGVEWVRVENSWDVPLKYLYATQRVHNGRPPKRGPNGAGRAANAKKPRQGTSPEDNNMKVEEDVDEDQFSQYHKELPLVLLEMARLDPPSVNGYTSLGKGSGGLVIAVPKKEQRFALKLNNIIPPQKECMFVREAIAHALTQSAGLRVPKAYEFCRWNDGSYNSSTIEGILMDKLDGCVLYRSMNYTVAQSTGETWATYDIPEVMPEEVMRTIAKTLHQWHECGFIHGDPHLGNWWLNTDDSIILFDLGRTIPIGRGKLSDATWRSRTALSRMLDFGYVSGSLKRFFELSSWNCTPGTFDSLRLTYLREIGDLTKQEEVMFAAAEAFSFSIWKYNPDVVMAYLHATSKKRNACADTLRHHDLSLLKRIDRLYDALCEPWSDALNDERDLILHPARGDGVPKMRGLEVFTVHPPRSGGTVAYDRWVASLSRATHIQDTTSSEYDAARTHSVQQKYRHITEHPLYQQSRANSL